MADNTQDTGQQDQAAYDPEHLAILKKGVEAWNKWREDNPQVIPNLEGANLSDAWVAGADLRYANLQGANLSDANLEGAHLSVANLAGANLSDANLKGAVLSHANLKGAVLSHANLEGADLRFANLKGAELFHANLQGADLGLANLEGADLRVANLQGANLSHANLEGANLRDANLKEADLRAVRRIRLDSTVVRGARFDTLAHDPWSVLRRTYTGSRLSFHLLFLLAFFLPYAAKTAGWVAVSQTQGQAGSGIAKLQQAAGELEAENHPAAVPVKKVVTALSDTMPNEQNGRWQRRRVWELVIGVDKGRSYWITAVMLIAYNVFRAALTWFVSAMREEEERSGHTPRWRRDTQPPHGAGRFRRFTAKPGGWSEAYGWLMWLHRPCRAMMVVAVLSFLYHAQAWLRLPVLIPAG